MMPAEKRVFMMMSAERRILTGVFAWYFRGNTSGVSSWSRPQAPSLILVCRFKCTGVNFSVLNAWIREQHTHTWLHTQRAPPCTLYSNMHYCDTYVLKNSDNQICVTRNENFWLGPRGAGIRGLAVYLYLPTFVMFVNFFTFATFAIFLIPGVWPVSSKPPINLSGRKQN